MTGIGLRSDYLHKLAKLCLKGFRFRGVYPCDHFARLHLKPGDLTIVNLSHSKHQGSHYVSVMLTRRYTYFMDPYGAECEDKYILKALKKTKKSIKFLYKRVQAHESIFCGFYSLCFLIIGSKNQKPLKAIRKQFHSVNLIENEKSAVYIIQQAIKINSVKN